MNRRRKLHTIGAVALAATLFAALGTTTSTAASTTALAGSAVGTKDAKGGPGDHGHSDSGRPDEIRMTWFGITNWHYQIGDVGVLLDGAVGGDPGIVSRARHALQKRGSIDYLLVGHNHGDHTEDTLNWAEQTGAPLYAPAAVCEDAAEAGLPAGHCHTVKGGETIRLNRWVEMRVVRYVHSVGCGQTSPASGGIETLGYLFTVRTPKKLLSLYTTDSGAGGPELVKEHIVDGENRGAPLSNLGKAMRDAGIHTFEVWQAGPESRPAAQARVIIPTFQPKYFMPHHIAARGGFNLLGGMHYPYDTSEFPKLMSILKDWGVPNVYPTNYFDAWEYDAKGLRQVDNAAVKRSVGLPDQGPGPLPQGTNPRAGQLECPED